MSSNVDPRKGGYITAYIDSAGRLDMESFAPSPFATLEEASAYAVEDVEEHGGSLYVFQLVPVAVARRDRAKLHKIKQGKK